MKEMKYRNWHNALCMVTVLFGNGVSFLAGAGDLYVITQICIWSAVILQWRVLVVGTKQDKVEKIKNEIKEFAELVNDPTFRRVFRDYTYLHPIPRRWHYRWYDKWKGITYVHLWSYRFDFDEGKHEFESQIKFPITDRQLFEMKLKGHVDMNVPTDVVPVLEYIGTELCDRLLRGDGKNS